MSYHLAIFDLDGTLADTWPWFVEALDEAAIRFDLHRPDAAEREALRTCDPREILRRLRVPIWKVPAITRYMRARKAEAGGRIGLFPGAGYMLERLSAAGLALAMVSSDSEANVRATLGTSATLIEHFACEASLFGKAAHLRRVLKLSGVAPGGAIYIGDEVRDAEAAHDVGIAFGAVTWGFATPGALRAKSPEALFTTFDNVAAFLAARQLVPG